MNDEGDEFSGGDATNFIDTSNSNLGTTGGCTGAAVTPSIDNAGIWFQCNDTVTAANSPYTIGGDDLNQDVAEWKILAGGSGVSQSSNYTSSASFTIWGVAIKPAVAGTTSIPWYKLPTAGPSFAISILIGLMIGTMGSKHELRMDNSVCLVRDHSGQDKSLLASVPIELWQTSDGTYQAIPMGTITRDRY
jgi:hypothetical protein